MGLFGPANVVGLDIGSVNVKAVQFQRAGNLLQMRNAMVVPTPNESVTDGNVVLPDVIASSILGGWNKYFSTRSVNLSIPSQHVTLKQVWIKAPPNTPLDELVKWELEKFLPLPVEEMHIQFQILQEQENNIQVLAAAAPRHIVDALVRLCRLAKLTPVSIEVPYLALTRLLFASDADLIGPHSTFLMDIGATQTQILFLANNTLYLVRAIPIAGASLTAAIAKGLGLPTNEAENLKQTKATLVAEEVKFEPYSLIFNAMTPVLKELVQELERSIDYFQSRANLYQELNVLISGGGAMLRGMDNYLQEALGVNVSYWLPTSAFLTKQSSQTKTLLPLLNLPAGLALRGAEKSFPLDTFERMEAALLV